EVISRVKGGEGLKFEKHFQKYLKISVAMEQERKRLEKLKKSVEFLEIEDENDSNPYFKHLDKPVPAIISNDIPKYAQATIKDLVIDIFDEYEKDAEFLNEELQEEKLLKKERKWLDANALPAKWDGLYNLENIVDESDSEAQEELQRERGSFEGVYPGIKQEKLARKLILELEKIVNKVFGEGYFTHKNLISIADREQEDALVKSKQLQTQLENLRMNQISPMQKSFFNLNAKIGNCKSEVSATTFPEPQPAPEAMPTSWTTLF
ncbi:9931_t:CDS:2, partial [Racocetra persica]